MILHGARQRAAHVTGLGPLSLGSALLLVALLPFGLAGALDGRIGIALIDWIQVAMLALSVACAWKVARLDSLPVPARWAFGLLAASLIVLMCADAAWAWIDAVLGQDPSQSWINWLYIPFYPLMLAGVMAFPRIFRSGTDRLRFGLDTLIVALGAGLVIWSQVALPRLPVIGPGLDALSLFVVVGQPALDCIATLGVAVVLLRLPAGRSRRPMIWLATALILNLLGNLVLSALSASSEFSTGGIADMLWIGSRWCFLAAAESQLRVQRALCETIEDENWTPSFQLLPYFAVIAGFATVLLDGTGGGVEAVNIGGAIVLTALVLLRQVIDRREAEALLTGRARLAGDARLAALVEHASEAILVLDHQRLIAYASPAAARLLGTTAEKLRYDRLEHYLHPDETLAAESLLRVTPGSTHSRRTLLRLRSADAWIWTECAITHLLERPEIGGIVLNVRDVTAQRDLEEQLRHQSFHDPLTGLTNRLLLGERISEALSEAHPAGSGIAVMFVDLDHFKMINDGLGHSSGDGVIAEAAQRLERAIRPGDLLARLGGDEFAILLQDLQDDDGVVDAAQRVMGAFREPFTVDAREIAVSASIGIAWAGPSDTVDVLLRNADLALNEAKARGRDRFHVFQPDLHATVLRKLQLHGDLRDLLERNMFTLVYQPILRLDSLQPAGFEALLRWPESAGVNASPSEAIAAAEESGLIVALGRWVVERALHELHILQLRWPGSRALRMTVNLSARQLQDQELADVVATSLHRHGIEPERLVLELTETAIAENPDDALRALQKLKALGVRLAIDDFGTGYSSLAHLARFPFDLLKVPKPFVDMIGHGDEDGARLARAVLALGASLRLETIAEGIEHPAQLALLRESGCELAQGFLLAHPMTLSALHGWLDTQARVA